MRPHTLSFYNPESRELYVWMYYPPALNLDRFTFARRAVDVPLEARELVDDGLKTLLTRELRYELEFNIAELTQEQRGNQTLAFSALHGLETASIKVTITGLKKLLEDLPPDRDLPPELTFYNVQRVDPDIAPWRDPPPTTGVTR
jgi:hypothetical protein